MPSRDANGNWVYSQAEYDHFNFTGEPFSGFVEGIGYTCTDIVVTASPINASGTQFMFDFNIISYVFDMSDISYNDEPTLSDTKSQQDSNTPDRSDYVKIPNAPKFEYGDRSWYNPMNIATFVDNVVIDLVNPLIDVVNTVPISAQLVYNEGWGALGSELYDAGKAVMRTPYDYVKGNYNYIANTPASQQWSDFKRDMSNPHTYEQGVAMGIGMYYGAKSFGKIPKAPGLLKEVPKGAYIPELDYPLMTTRDGFLLKGFNTKAPFNIRAQRFGYISPDGPQHWGIQLGPNKFITRFFFAIKTEWGNPLTSYTTGTISKGTPIKIGVVGPQKPIYKYPGLSIQIVVESAKVIKQPARTVNIPKK